ncbi:amino acid adenylation domain-containing protein, partial [Chengkuizengella marina]
KDEVVGLLAERSLEMVIGILGILKAGGAFLAIDPYYPEDRKNYMLQNSQLNILLTDKKWFSDQIFFEGHILNLNDPTIYIREAKNLAIPSNGSDLSYIIYTSGSTGQPKGIMVEHRTLVNLVYYQQDHTLIPFNGNILQYASSSFDVSYQEIFSTLLIGGKLYIVEEEVKKEPEMLFNFIDQKQIDVIFMPTALLKFISTDDNLLAQFPTCVSHIITAGEQLFISNEFKAYLKEHSLVVHNHYGPSEAHVVTAYSINGENVSSVPPIGKGISNTELMIMDQYHNLQPIGVSGELYIASDILARGYLNRYDLTAEKFLVHPYKSGKKMYKTGDLARWLPDGNIEYIGRVDHQVKVRGYRVELGEIEAQLLSHEQIKEVIVIVKEERNQGSKYLCGYYVALDELKPKDVRDFLSVSLPEYMVPSFLIPLEVMPLTRNGKIDRQALPEPEGNHSGVQYLPPRTKIEKQLVGLWKEVLGI